MNNKRKKKIILIIALFLLLFGVGTTIAVVTYAAYQPATLIKDSSDNAVTINVPTN